MFEELASKLPVDEYARLQDLDREAGTEILILPGGGHEELEEYLTCRVCGRFVCYKHNPSVKPTYKEEAMCIPTPEHDGWSRPVPQRIIDKFTNKLAVTV